MFAGSVVLALGVFGLASAQSSLPGTWGYEVANSTYGVNYFYWFFNPTTQHTTSDTPLILWLTGGPGCSSEMALFFENGPYTVNSAGTGLTPNQYGWNQNAYLLYVDQPGGTGFSTVKNPKGYVTNEAQVAGDMYTFLTNLFVTHSQLAKLPLYVFGESYAGHYVPAITSYLVANAPNINLKGVAIGNGFIDPGVQTASFGPYIYFHGLMTKQQLATTQSGVAPCQADIAAGKWTAAFNDCTGVLDTALQYCSQQKGSQCNVYNIEAPCNGPLCYNFNNIQKFLNNPSIQKQLGVSGIQWQTCDTTPYEYLEKDFDQSYRQDIPVVLAAGIPVTIYNGNLDIICNFYGAADLLSSMPWPGQTAFAGATNTTWTVAGSTAGSYRTANGLTFVVVNNAGHMVPHDQPANALALVQNVLTNSW